MKIKGLRKVLSVITALVVVCIIGISLTACGGNTGGNTDNNKKTEKISFTDVTGASFEFDKPVEKAAIQYSGSGGAFMTMSGLFGRDVYKHIAGMDNGLAENRNDMWKNFIKTVPELKDVKKIGSLGKDFDVEGVINSGAEVLILSKDAKEQVGDTQAKLEKAGIKVLYIDFHDETVENHVKSTEIMGKMFGREEQAKKMIDFYKEHRAKAEKAAEAGFKKTGKRPNLYIEVGASGPEKFGNTYSNKYMWGGIAYSAGANSIADNGNIAKAAPVDSEYLLKSNPDKIVFTGSYWPKAKTSIRMGFEANEAETKKLVDAYFTRSGWEGLDAVKKKDVHVIHHGLAREMYDFVGYEFFAKVCYPEESKDIDPTASLKEYYEKFLPYEFSGLWFYDYK